MEMLDINKIKLDYKTRLSIVFISILLGVNSLNLILDKAIHILVTIEIYYQENVISIIFQWYSEFCWIWLDILTLINGVFFMLLFKKVALK